MNHYGDEDMLRCAWEQWKIIAHKIGVFQSKVILNIFYFLIIFPFGLGVRLFSDPLRLRRQNGSNWISKIAEHSIGERARRQY
jgi:hypothetical protein